tara:strand:- start:1664 stop:2104 length:441 start_codon:yes stop_codon:yes gene_type:complete
MFQSHSDTKIAVLEERLSVYEQMMGRIDSAIQKISETSQSISQMLAIHNEKIEQCNRTDNVIVTMIEDIKKTSKEQHDQISKELGERIEKVEVEIRDIGKIKWMVVGMGTLAALVVTIISQLAGGVLNPVGTHSHEQTQQERLQNK